MKLRKTRRAFTIVELVIVVAVIGVLAAVLIPTFVNLTNKANKASDSSLITNLNTALAMAENDDEVYKGKAVSEKNETMHDAIVDLEYEGFYLENLSTRSGYKLLWNIETNRFCLENETDFSKYHAEDYWKIVKSASELKVTGTEDEYFSGYANSNFKEAEKSNVVVLSGFDVGDVEGFTLVTLDRSADTNTRSKNLVLRTTSAHTALAINAPKDHVLRTGSAGKIEPLITAANSFVDHGKSSWITLTDGRYVLSSESDVGILYLNVDKNNTEQSLAITYEKGSTPLTEDQIKRPALSLAENETAKIVEITYEETNTTETIYLQGSSTFEEDHVLVSTDGGQTMAPVSSDDASDAAKAVANDYNGGDVEETGLSEQEKEQEQEVAVETAQNEEDVEKAEEAGYEVTHHEALAPTCTEDGHTAYDSYFVNNEEVKIGYKVIPATGHDAEHEDGKCSICGAQVYYYRVGNGLYKSNQFSSAWTAAKNSANAIVLLADRTLNALQVNGTFTFDLNGFTLTLNGYPNIGSDGTTGAAIFIDGGANWVHGNLTMKNGTLNMVGTGYSTYGIYNYGTITLKDMTVNSACEKAIYANGQTWGSAGVTTLDNVILNSTHSSGTALSANSLKNWNGTIKPTVVVKDSTITATYNAVAFYAVDATVENCSITATNNNALWTARSAMASGVTGTVTVKGNTTVVAGSDYRRLNAQDGNVIVVIEGTYNFDPSNCNSKNYVDGDAYNVTDNGDGTWTVTAK